MLFNFTILISLFLFVKNNDSCNDRNCFDCLYFNCVFNSNQCSSPQSSQTSLSPSISMPKCLSISETCTDPTSKTLLSTHCHLSHNETNNKNSYIYSFWLKPSLSGIYGHSNLFCKLELPKLKNQTSLTLYLENNNIHNQQLHPIFLEAITNTSSTNNYILEMKDNYITLEHINKIVLYYYQISELSTSPFELLILANNTSVEEKKKEGLSIGIYIGIGAVVLGCLGFSILIYCCSRKMGKKKESAHTGRNNTRRTSTRKKSRRNTVLAQINRLFAGPLRPIGFNDSIKEKGNCCTICLEMFKKNIKICVTPCGHVFHYKCLYDWLHGNIMNPKCPNCNANLIEKEHEEINNVNTIEINRNRRNTYRNERTIPQEEISNNRGGTTEAENININTNFCNDNLNNKEEEGEDVEIESVE